MLDTKITLVGVPEVIRQLEFLIPGAVTAMKKELKTIATPAIAAVQSNIPTVSPLSGMNHSGRTKYGGAKAGFGMPVAKIIKDSDTHPLVQITVKTPVGASGFAVYDMAGRGTGKGRRATTKSAEVKKVGTRTYRYTKNGQGQAMIRSLGGQPSRKVYPAVERMMPSMELASLAVLDRYAAMVNRKIDRI